MNVMNRSRLIVHIGTGKTGTTTLQQTIFPILHQAKLVFFCGVDLNLKLKDIINCYSVFGDLDNPILTKKVKEFRYFFNSQPQYATRTSLISLESLHGWDPSSWSEMCLLNKILFSGLADSVEIMITMRDTKNYLDSVYMQMIHEGFRPKSPTHFFLKKDQYKIAKGFVGRSGQGLEIFSIDELRYEDLFSMYSNSFDRVYIFTMQEALSSEFLKSLNLCDNKLIYSIQEKIKYTSFNRSFSKLATMLTYRREKLLNSFGLKTFTSKDELDYCQLLGLLLK